MNSEQDAHGLEIGQSLKDARRRIGMDVKEAEERTKIRAKYLRALEADDWEVLPAPAYVRGFLRTYGQLLGLDGEALADEFRRRHEEPAAPAGPASEPLLQGRRSNGSRGSRPPSRGPLIAGVAGGIVVLLVLLALLGGDDDDGGTPMISGLEDGASGEADGKGGDGKRGAKKPVREPIDIRLESLGSVQVCLASEGEALIDGQVLAEGVIEEFGGEKRYRVDLPGGGVVRVEAGGESERLTADGETSWEVNSNGISPIEYAGPECP